MSDRSFVRFGGLAGILLALTSWVAVVVYFALIPTAQQAAAGDPAAFVASLAQNSSGITLYNAIYALLALWALIGVVAVYFQLRAAGEAWAFFAVLVGALNAGLTIVSSLQQMAHLRYVATLAVSAPDAARIALGEPAPLNPLNLQTNGLTAIWFLIVALLMLRTELPRLLAYLGFVACADLAVGFITTLVGTPVVPIITAVIAGAVGGPVFWLWLGILLRREHAISVQVSVAH